MRESISQLLFGLIRTLWWWFDTADTTRLDKGTHDNPKKYSDWTRSPNWRFRLLSQLHCFSACLAVPCLASDHDVGRAENGPSKTPSPEVHATFRLAPLESIQRVAKSQHNWLAILGPLTRFTTEIIHAMLSDPNLVPLYRTPLE